MDTQNLDVKLLVLLELLKRGLLVLELVPGVVDLAGVHTTVNVVSQADVDLGSLDASDFRFDHAVQSQVCAGRDRWVNRVDKLLSRHLGLLSRSLNVLLLPHSEQETLPLLVHVQDVTRNTLVLSETEGCLRKHLRGKLRLEGQADNAVRKLDVHTLGGDVAHETVDLFTLAHIREGLDQLTALCGFNHTRLVRQKQLFGASELVQYKEIRELLADSDTLQRVLGLCSGCVDKVRYTDDALQAVLQINGNAVSGLLGDGGSHELAALRLVPDVDLLLVHRLAALAANLHFLCLRIQRKDACCDCLANSEMPIGLLDVTFTHLRNWQPGAHTTKELYNRAIGFDVDNGTLGLHVRFQFAVIRPDRQSLVGDETLLECKANVSLFEINRQDADCDGESFAVFTLGMLELYIGHVHFWDQARDTFAELDQNAGDALGASEDQTLDSALDNLAQGQVLKAKESLFQNSLLQADIVDVVHRVVAQDARLVCRVQFECTGG